MIFAPFSGFIFNVTLSAMTDRVLLRALTKIVPINAEQGMYKNYPLVTYANSS